MSDERHPDLRPLLADDPSTERREVLGHLRDCPRCRAAVVAEDPSRLFALLALEPVAPARLDRLTRGVERALDERAAPAFGGRRWAVASVAASLLLAGVFGLYVWKRDGRATALPTVAWAPETEIGVLAAAEPAFELLSPDAQTVNMAVGDVQLVMIFDKDLDL